MNNKTITMVVNSEDVRSLIGNSLSHILNRHNRLYQEELKQLNEAAQEGGRREILEVLKNIGDLYRNTISELDNAAPLILELDESLPTNTKVVENLPDLLEDGSGVD